MAVPGNAADDKKILSVVSKGRVPMPIGAREKVS